MSIALIGPSGSGKGTHIPDLVQSFDLLHLSTGDLFREHLNQQTALGLLAEKYIQHGELVPDEIVDAMIEERLRKADPAQSILFDGFPRTRTQAKFVDEIFAELDHHLNAVIYLHVPDEEIIERTTRRRICHLCQAPFDSVVNPFEAAGCPYQKCHGEHLYQREDDTVAMAETRLHIFHRITEPLLQYYQEQGLLIVIDGQGSPKQVGARLRSQVGAVQAGQPRYTSPETLQKVYQGQPSTPAEAGRRLQATRQAGQPFHISFNMVLLGGPGSGKGTQAVQLSHTLQLVHIATGNLFRHNIKNETALGRQAQAYINRGELVPDAITETMLLNRLEQPDTHHGFILDGFPRALTQAEALTEMLGQLNRRLATVLHINVSDDEIVRRLSGRLICRNCQTPYHIDFKPPRRAGRCDECGSTDLYQRDDDNPDTIRARLRNYHRQTEPLIEYYQAAGLLLEINGEGEVDNVSQSALNAIHALR